MNTVTVDGLDRFTCALLMVYRAVDELKAAHLMSGGKHDISEKGREVATRLEAAGFEFNPGEMEAVTAELMKATGVA